MKRFLQIASFAYVAFALFIAAQSLAPTQTPNSRNAGQGSVMVPSRSPLLDHERLDDVGKKAEDTMGRIHYRIEVWTASWCRPCKRYKAVEVPALLKAGFKVKVLDYDKDNPPKDVKRVPTIKLYYKGTFIYQKTYWRAKDIAKYVDNHLSLKG